MNDGQSKLTFPFSSRGRDCRRILLKVAPEDIAYFVMVLEGYEVLGVARTINPEEGVVEILASPDFAGDTGRLLEALKDEISLEVIRA